MTNTVKEMISDGLHKAALNFDKAVKIDKGQQVDIFTKHPAVSKLIVDGHWESPHDIDLILTVDGANGQQKKCIFYGDRFGNGISLSEDARTSDGDSSTPEETATIDLSALEAGDVVTVYITVYTPSGPTQTLSDVERELIIIRDANSADVIGGFTVPEDTGDYTSIKAVTITKEGVITNIGDLAHKSSCPAQEIRE